MEERKTDIFQPIAWCLSQLATATCSVHPCSFPARHKSALWLQALLPAPSPGTGSQALLPCSMLSFSRFSINLHRTEHFKSNFLKGSWIISSQRQTSDLGHARQKWLPPQHPRASPGAPGVPQCWIKITEKTWKNSGRCKRKEEVTGSGKNAEEPPWIHAGSLLNRGSSLWGEPSYWSLGTKVLLLHLLLFLWFLPILTLILHPKFQLLKVLNGSDSVRLLMVRHHSVFSHNSFCFSEMDNSFHI